MTSSSFLRRLSLRSKLLLLLILIPLLMLSSFLALVVRTFETDKVGFVFESSANLSRSVGAQVRSDLAMVIAKLQPLLQDYLENKTWTPKAQTLFDKEGSFWSLVIFIDNANNPNDVIEKKQSLWHQTQEKNPRLLQTIQTLQKGERKILSLGEQKIFIGEKVANKTGEGSITYGLIYWAKDLAGIFEAKRNLKLLLINKQGQVVLGPTSMQENSVRDLFPEKTLKKVTETKNLAGAELISGKDKSDYLISYAEAGDNEMAVVSLIKKADALTAVTQLIQKSMIFFALLVALSFMASLFSSKQLTSSLMVLVEATKKIARGQFDVNLKSRSEDEVGTLTQSFNLMSTEIVRLLAETQEKARMEAELKTAQLVQSTLFPKENYTGRGVEIFGHYEPASECGGDWWSYSEVGDRFYIWIGDATGHGAPAALVTSAAKSAASFIEEMMASPSEALRQLNRSIYDVTNGEILMTFFVACYDTVSRTLTYANASHEHPFLFHRKDQTTFSKADLILLDGNNNPRLGESRDTLFQETTLELQEGDVIMFYTDGIADISNSEGKKFGDRNLTRLLCKAASQNSGADVVSTLKNELAEFRKSEPLIDDVTFVAFALPLQKS